MIRFLFLISILSCQACSNSPGPLTGETVTLELGYINWACDCPDFIETRLSETLSEPGSQDCIYLEPARADLQLPDSFFAEAHFHYCLRVQGQFYQRPGVPASYAAKTLEAPEEGRIFRYQSYQLIPRRHE